MNFLLYFAGGVAVYLGLLLVILALVLEIYAPESRSLTWVVRLLALAGIILLGASSPAVPVFVSVLWGFLFVSWRICSNQNNYRTSFFYSYLLVLFILFNIVLLAGSIYRSFLPPVPAQSPARLLVIGDSLTAGEHYDSIDKYWPGYLEEKAEFPVEVLARPGARLTDGRQMLAKWLEEEDNARPGETAVVVLLGGNDLLAQEATADFEDDFESLLKIIPAGESSVYIFELPRPPLSGKYGLIQRRLVEKYNFRLINRIHLARVMFPKENTTDGIHLSQKGHRQLAGFVQTLFE